MESLEFSQSSSRQMLEGSSRRRTWNCCCCSTLLTILLPPPSQLLTTSSRHITSSSSKDDVDDPASARLRQKTFLKVTFSVGKILSQNRVYITFNTLHSLQGRQEKNMGLNQLAVAVCWCNHKSLQGTLEGERLVRQTYSWPPRIIANIGCVVLGALDKYQL